MFGINKKLNLSGDEKISDFPKTFNKLVQIVERLIDVVLVLLVATITLLVEVFFSSTIAQTFSIIHISWSQIPEGYKLLILGLPLAVIASILSHVINRKYIDPLLNKKQ